MAIRSGTGGLKYPLPNNQQQAAIAAASAGGSASASAYGANRQYAGTKMRVQADILNSERDRQFRAQSQLQEQGFRAEQAYFDREHQKGAQLEGQAFRSGESQLDRQLSTQQHDARLQQQREMQWQDQYFREEQNRLDRDFTTERDKARFQQDQAAFEGKVDAGIEEDIRAGKLELTPEQQAELQKLEEGKAKAKDLDPAQQAEFQSQYEAKRRQILRSARPAAGPSATAVATKRTTYYDPQTGTFADQMGPGRVPGTVNEKGAFEPIAAGPDTSKQDAERQRWVDKKADALLKHGDETGKPLTPDQAFAKARQESEAYFRARNPQPQPVPGQPQSPAPGQPPAQTAQPGAAPPVLQPNSYWMNGQGGGTAGAAPQPAAVPGNALPTSMHSITPGAGAPSGPLDMNSVAKPKTAEEYAALKPGEMYLKNGELKRKPI